MELYSCLLISFFLSLCSAQDGTGNLQDLPPKVHEIVLLEPTPIENLFGRDTLNLECSASGYPAPTIEWSFNGVTFVKDQTFDGKEGIPIRHTITGNRISISKVKGKTNGDPSLYDTGRYRCIATNTVGSVFLEKYIKIRVMGKFNPGSGFLDNTKKWNPTVGRRYSIKCPEHTLGYGTEYRWGIVPRGTRIPEYWRPGDPNPRVFQNTAGDLIYSVVFKDDITESRNVGGLRCILTNFGITTSSNQQVLWSAYDTVSETRKPVLEAYMPAVMQAPVDTEFTMICGASGFPVPKVTWQYQGIDIVSRFGDSEELNFEFFQFLGGGLELRIRRITRYSGGTFKCFAENTLGKVWRTGQLRVSFPPKWINRFPERVDIPIGNRYVLKCNATGTPQPKFEWFQNSKKIVVKDDRKTTSGDKPGEIGGVLTISNAQFEDNGIYICVAMNNLDTLTMSIFIQVKEMAPKFEIPLDDPIYLFRTSTMMIHCNPKGGPVPTKAWQKDGIAIVEDNHFKVLANGSLQITNVQKTDAGIYKCIATNNLGTDESEGTAVVLEPTVITHPPENRIYTVGFPYAVLFCGASWDSRLDLRIEWYKGGVRMAKFSDKIYLEQRATGPPRLLYINDLTIYDAGNYSCHAYTTVGEIVSEQWAFSKLTIKGPPEPPAGVVVTGGCEDYLAKLTWERGEEIGVETRRFYIEFSTNNSMGQGQWFGGRGDPLLKKSEIVAFPGTRVQFDLTRNELVPGANLIFRIRAASDHLIGRPSRPSKQGDCRTPPDAPVMNPLNVTGLTFGPNTLSIHWRAVTDVYHGGPNYRYVVGYRKIGDPAFTINEITDLNTTMYNISSPGLFEQYEFYVQSRNDLGDGPKPTYKSAYSGRDPPTSAPSNFRVGRISRYSVELRWNAVENADGYRVRYYNITDAEGLRGRSKRSVGTNKIEIKYRYFMGNFSDGASLSDITAQVDFLAAVAAVNNGGVGPESEMVEFQSQARVPGVPTQVNIQVYGKSAHINWSPPLEPNGYIETYEIAWYKSAVEDSNGAPDSGEITRITRDRREREVYLKGNFEPMTYYNIKVSARNRVGPGADWEHILFSVSAPDIPGKPGAPSAKPFDDSAINITFQRPDYGGLPAKFIVYYRPKGRFFEDPQQVQQAFPQRAWLLVTGLEFLVYDFWTVGVNSLGQSETSDVTEQRPIIRPKPQAHASEFEWWRSNWFIAISMCVLFILITMTVVITLLKGGPKMYKPLKDEGYNNYGGSSANYSKSATQMQPMTSKPAQAAAVGGIAGASSAYDQNGYDDGRNFSYSDAQSDHDAPPPRYSDQSSIDKKDGTDSESGSQTESGSETESGSQTGSGSEYSDDEDGSYYSDEEKKRDSGSEDEEEEDEDFSTFV